MSSLETRNVMRAAGRTSIRLERELWGALAEIAANERTTLPHLLRRIEKRPGIGTFTSAVRVFIVAYYRGLVAVNGMPAGAGE